MLVEQCAPMREFDITSKQIHIMAPLKACEVHVLKHDGWKTEPFPPVRHERTTISEIEFMRLAAQGRARIATPSVAVAKPVVKKASEPTKGSCELETCTGRCGMPLHTPSVVELAKAIRTGHVLWGDLV
jgi:hypothetical protein